MEKSLPEPEWEAVPEQPLHWAEEVNNRKARRARAAAERRSPQPHKAD